MFEKLAFLLYLLASLSAGYMLEPEAPWNWNVLDPSKYSDNIKKVMAQYPDGNQPDYTPPTSNVPASSIKAINFYADGPQDNSGQGDQGCHGGGAEGDIMIPFVDFQNPKLCPSGKGGDGGNDDLEGNGASFTISGKLGPCQLNFYSATGCNDKDWVGYLHGAGQQTCNAPKDMDGNLIKGMRSFNYICPDA